MVDAPVNSPRHPWWLPPAYTARRAPLPSPHRRPHDPRPFLSRQLEKPSTWRTSLQSRQEEQQHSHSPRDRAGQRGRAGGVHSVGPKHSRLHEALWREAAVKRERKMKLAAAAAEERARRELEQCTFSPRVRARASLGPPPRGALRREERVGGAGGRLRGEEMARQKLANCRCEVRGRSQREECGEKRKEDPPVFVTPVASRPARYERRGSSTSVSSEGASDAAPYASYEPFEMRRPSRGVDSIAARLETFERLAYESRRDGELSRRGESSRRSSLELKPSMCECRITTSSSAPLPIRKGLLAAKDVPMDTFQRLASDAHEFALRASKARQDERQWMRQFESPTSQRANHNPSPRSMQRMFTLLHSSLNLGYDESGVAYGAYSPPSPGALLKPKVCGPASGGHPTVSTRSCELSVRSRSASTDMPTQIVADAVFRAMAASLKRTESQKARQRRSKPLSPTFLRHTKSSAGKVVHRDASTISPADDSSNAPAVDMSSDLVAAEDDASFLIADEADVAAENAPSCVPLLQEGLSSSGTTSDATERGSSGYLTASNHCYSDDDHSYCDPRNSPYSP